MRVLVADDEPLARHRLLRMLARMPTVVATAEAGNGVEALACLTREHFDVLLLDIHMPGPSGLEVAAALVGRVPVIFVTAYDAHALRAFEVAAVDYLVKPVNADRLTAALARIALRPEATAAQTDAVTVFCAPERLAVRHRGCIQLFDPATITRLYATGKYVGFLVEGAEYLTDASLASLAERFAGQGFLQVHRGEVINLHQVRALHDNEVELSDGQRASVSRRSAAALRARLGLARR